MTTYLAWILIIHYCAGSSCAATVVIDNIASREECERVQTLARTTTGTVYSTSRCIEVRRVKS